MRTDEIEQISCSPLILIENYTRLHVSFIFASNICRISQSYYHAILSSYLCGSLGSALLSPLLYSKAMASLISTFSCIRYI